MHGARWLVTVGLVLGMVTSARADVERVEITSRRDVGGGRSFGTAGPYEVLEGIVHLAVDPANPHNRIIPDLALAAKDAAGRVHAVADFYLLRPKDPSRGNGTLFLDIANRGNKTALGTINRRGRSDGDAEVGDGFLLRQGFTVLWVGWQADLEPGPDTIRVEVPRALGVEGLMRGDFILARDAVRTRVPSAPLTPPLERQGASDVLLVRDDPYSSAATVPRDRWRFSEDRRELIVDGGLAAGKVYDLFYRARDPFIAGLGFAAVRDVVSACRTGAFAGVSVRHTMAFGVSQSGRMLRDFLYQGFNADERGRRVFDGLMIHIAGGARGSFTHRFAASGGDTFYYPTRFPFATEELIDPVTGVRDGLLARAKAEGVLPKIFFTNSAVEYWGGRAASLTHTSLDGQRDLPLGDESRMYFLSGQQHSPAAFPPRIGAQDRTQQLANALDAQWVLRPLVLHMRAWIADNAMPPRSRYPRIDDGTLVLPADVRFPTAIGRTPTRVPPNPRVDAGPDFATKGIPSWPARFGAPLVARVPAVDGDGNETSGIRMPELSVPLGTHTGWNFRDPSVGSPQSFVRLVGSYVPFAATKAAREAVGDTRLSRAERYRDRGDYLSKIRAAANALVAEGFLLADDVAAIEGRAGEHWDWLQAQSESTARR